MTSGHLCILCPMLCTYKYQQVAEPVALCRPTQTLHIGSNDYCVWALDTVGVRTAYAHSTRQIKIVNNLSHTHTCTHSRRYRNFVNFNVKRWTRSMHTLHADIHFSFHFFLRLRRIQNKTQSKVIIKSETKRSCVHRSVFVFTCCGRKKFVCWTPRWFMLEYYAAFTQVTTTVAVIIHSCRVCVSVVGCCGAPPNNISIELWVSFSFSFFFIPVARDCLYCKQLSYDS